MTVQGQAHSVAAWLDKHYVVLNQMVARVLETNEKSKQKESSAGFAVDVLANPTGTQQASALESCKDVVLVDNEISITSNEITVERCSKEGTLPSKTTREERTPPAMVTTASTKDAAPQFTEAEANPKEIQLNESGLPSKTTPEERTSPTMVTTVSTEDAAPQFTKAEANPKEIPLNESGLVHQTQETDNASTTSPFVVTHAMERPLPVHADTCRKEDEPDNAGMSASADEMKDVDAEIDSDSDSDTTVIENVEGLKLDLEELNEDLTSLSNKNNPDPPITINKSRRRSRKILPSKLPKVDARIERLVENNKISIENIEQEVLRRTNMSESRFEKLEQQVHSLVQRIETERTKYEKEMYDTRLKYEQLLEKSTSKLEESKETIMRQKLEITDLRNKVKSQGEFLGYQKKMSEEIKDLDTRFTNKLKEKRDKELEERERTTNLIKEVQLSVQTKAARSELDQFKSKMLADTKNKVKEKSTKWADEEVPMERSISNAENRQEGNDTNHGSNKQKKKVVADVVLLMDSNKRHIDAEEFGPNTWKIRAAMAQELTTVIERFDFSNVQHIIISTGTNDTDERRADDIFADLVGGVELLKQNYKANIYVSQLPPRKAKRKDVVREVNSLIKNGVKEGTHVILQENLSEKDLHDEKHIKKGSLWKVITNMTNKIHEVSGMKFSPTLNKDGNRQQQSVSTKAQPNMKQILGVMAKSNEFMMENMRQLFEQCLP